MKLEYLITAAGDSSVPASNQNSCYAMSGMIDVSRARRLVIKWMATSAVALDAGIQGQINVIGLSGAIDLYDQFNNFIYEIGVLGMVGAGAIAIAQNSGVQAVKKGGPLELALDGLLGLKARVSQVQLLHTAVIGVPGSTMPAHARVYGSTLLDLDT